MRRTLVVIALIDLVARAVASGANPPATPNRGTVAEKPFSIRQREGVDWLFKPDGARFFGESS
jgi:hypothetical protein